MSDRSLRRTGIAGFLCASYSELLGNYLYINYGRGALVLLCPLLQFTLPVKMAHTTLMNLLQATIMLQAVSNGVQVAVAVVYVVGGAAGWDFAPTASYFSDWASELTFMPGDKLSFRYDPTDHNLLRVNISDYATCNTLNPVQQYQSGNDLITLDKPGAYCFICGFAGHCEGGGMLIKLAVMGSVATLPPPPKTPPPPPPVPLKSPPPPLHSPLHHLYSLPLPLPLLHLLLLLLLLLLSVHQLQQSLLTLTNLHHLPLQRYLHHHRHHGGPLQRPHPGLLHHEALIKTRRWILRLHLQLLRRRSLTPYLVRRLLLLSMTHQLHRLMILIRTLQVLLAVSE